MLLTVPQVGLDGMEMMPIVGPPTHLGQSCKLLTTRGHVVSAASPYLLSIWAAKAPRGGIQAQQHCRNIQCVSLPQ